MAILGWGEPKVVKLDGLFKGGSKYRDLKGWSAWAGFAAIFMIHKFNVLPFSCITIHGLIGVRFQLFLFKAARPGDHFLSERPEKCVPMAGGEGVTFKEKINWNLTPISNFQGKNQLESDPNFLKQGF